MKPTAASLVLRPILTQQYFEKIDDLRITLDISHWCNTAETFLHDQEEAVALAISRTDHIHSRVGYTEGPQITDPRAPEWKEALDFHLQCWDKVVAIKQKENAEFLSFTLEFGAPPYLGFAALHKAARGKPMGDKCIHDAFIEKQVCDVFIMLLNFITSLVRNRVSLRTLPGGILDSGKVNSNLTLYRKYLFIFSPAYP